MKSVAQSFISHQFQPLISFYPLQISPHSLSPSPSPSHSPPFPNLILSLKSTPNPNPKPCNSKPLLTPKSSHQQKTHISKTPQKQTQNTKNDNVGDDGIPIDHVKTLVKFKSRHNFIRVIQVSRVADHPFAGSRLLLLDSPGNIHSISFLFKLLTNTYFDVFATLPPILPPPGPLAILGFGAGSAAKLILQLYPQALIHGYELDPSVISVAREYFGLSKLEKEYPDRLFIYIANALNATIKDGFSGILVDLFSEGSLLPELQDPNTWEKMKRGLRKGGRIMVNVGGSCVEAEDPRRDGKAVMEETLRALEKVFPGEISVLRLGNGKDDSSIALTGELPNLDSWKEALPKSLRFYVDMWTPFDG